MEKSSIVEEKTGGRISRSSGAGTLEGLSEANKDLHEVTKRRFQSRPLDLEGHVARDQCITNSRLEKAESRGERTHEVRTRDLIIVVDHEKNEDHRYGPKAFVDSKSGKRGSSS
jgi:hypothetical protein